MRASTVHIDQRFIIEPFEPAYISLRSGEIKDRVKAGLKELEDCCACPRNCHVNRIAVLTAMSCSTLMKPPVGLASGGSMSDGRLRPFRLRKEPDAVESLRLEMIEVKWYVGGLVKSFCRNAA